MTIKLIVGLANPGIQYTSTRHNIGALYTKLLVTHYGQKLKKESKFYGFTAKLSIVKHDVYVLLPTTYINSSGKAVAAMATFYNIIPKEILVAHDELDLLPGNAKLQLTSNRNSHNGLKDIIYFLGTNQFHRLRIGIGHPGNKNQVVDFVLSKPSIMEFKLIYDVILEAICCTEILITQNYIKAINRLHAYRPI